LRIGTGLIAFYLVATYTPDLETFFGDNGLVPLATFGSIEEPAKALAVREALPQTIRETLPRHFRFSYLDYVHDRTGLQIFHGFGLAILGLYTAGCFTRLTSVLSLVVFLSYVHRGPMLTAQVEPVVAFVLLYLCIGPAGRSLSVDGWLRSRRLRSHTGAKPSGTLPNNVAGTAVPFAQSVAANVSVRLIQVHLTMAYAMMGIGKLAGEVWWSGFGMWLLIARPEMRLVDWTWLADYPKLVAIWTHALPALEIAFSVLVWNRAARPLFLFLSFVAWLSLAPVSGLVTYSLMMIVANLSFFPNEWLRSRLGLRTAQVAS
jgi:hypothetical protein